MSTASFAGQEVVAQLEVERRVAEGTPRLSQPREVAHFSKGRLGITFDRSGLATFREPAVPADLNVGFDLFTDRDRTNPYPAPLGNILSSLEHHGQTAVLEEPCFVTFRGNIAKLLVTPYNGRDEWHIEAERRGSTVYLNVTEPPSELRRAAADANDGRKRAMQYWGFAFEELCSAGGAGLRLGIDSTEGFNSVAVTTIGKHRLVIASEVDCERAEAAVPAGASAMSRYMELKTSRLMDTPRQVENFERNKLIKWWAQSYPAGVGSIMVGFRDDDGFVQKLQELQTSKLPRYVSGKRGAWDANVCLTFLDTALTWLRGHLDALPPGCRLRMEYCPTKRKGSVLLLRDPTIPPFLRHGQPGAALYVSDSEGEPGDGSDVSHKQPAKKQKL